MGRNNKSHKNRKRAKQKKSSNSYYESYYWSTSKPGEVRSIGSDIFGGAYYCLNKKNIHQPESPALPHDALEVLE